MFTPTRTAALEALDRFAPTAGMAYAQGRNFDLPKTGTPAVSLLSPYIRHRLITEKEVLNAVLQHHSPKDASKFIQEVFWRTYWKGWLELRPQVWRDYQEALQAGINRLQTESGLRAEFDAACLGDTNIECFNYWAQTLVKDGYIHNHARMWFASIWVFTLRLPWALGADFFMRHLLDGDPASNTLSWRWVAGMQTKGKTYLATPDNIETFTKGRFKPRADSLAVRADALPSADHPTPSQLPFPTTPNAELRTGVLFHEDDVHADHLAPVPDGQTPSCSVSFAADRSPLEVSTPVLTFAETAVRTAAPVGATHAGNISDVIDWARANDLRQIITAYAPVGPVANGLDKIEHALKDDGIAVIRKMRAFDRLCWPHATKGFFKFKENIPDFINKI